MRERVVIATLKRLGYPYMLVSFGLLLLVSPILENVIQRTLVLDTLVLLVLISGVIVVSTRPIQVILSLVMAFGMFLLGRLSSISGSSTLGLIAMLIGVCFFSYLAVAVIRDIVTVRRRVNADMIFGSLCGYLLVGMVFAFLYQVMQYLDPASFAGGKWVDINDGAALRGFIYFSFVTLSTLGYGDIVPETIEAGSFVYMEAIIGQIYLAVLVARLVGLNIAQQAESHVGDQPPSSLL